MGGKKKQTVGYKYFLGMHASLCLGPVDKITRIKYGDKVAWEGESTGGPLQIDAPELFGGESGEGGIQGQVDVLMGEPTQSRNDYLLSRLGSLISAFRGVVTLVFRQVYWGTSPYIKAISVTAQRIFVQQDGAAQWYSEKAAIGQPLADEPSPPATAAPWRWVVDSGAAIGVPPLYLGAFDDSGWEAVPGAFTGALSVNYGDVESVWVRRDISFGSSDVPSYIRLGVTFDHACAVWWNETLVGYFSGDGVRHIDVAKSSIAADNVLAVQTCPAGLNATLATLSVSIGWPQSSYYDMNPAHIIRECITNSDGGMGYADADVDAASFEAAADTLHAEGFGLSLLWEQQGSIEEFVGDVMTHIDGRIYVHPRTGLWTLKLIRADYDVGDLPTLGPAEVLRVEDYARPQFGELANSVTVKYWDAVTQQDAALSVDDPALIQMQGKVSGVSFDYPGITSSTLAARVAQRDLRAVSSQLLSATIYCNRSAALLLPGDPFLFDWPQLHAEPIVCRVGKIELGDAQSGEVKISIIEDVFGLAPVGIVQDPGSSWTDPSAETVGATTALALEMPYYEMVQRYGESRTNALLTETPEAGMLLLTGSRPVAAINGTGYVAGEEMRERVDFSPSGSLASAAAHGDTLLDIVWLNDILPATGSHIQVGPELMRFDGLDSNGLSLVGRGVLDTVPASHAYGAACWGWDAFAVTDEVERAEGETVSCQLVPRGTSAIGPYSAAVDVEFDARALRPYPPAKLRINSEAYPDAIIGALSLSWAHRDRLMQTATLVDTDAASIGPEPGTTYTLRIYGDGGSLLHTESGISGTSFNYTAESSVVAPTFVSGSDYIYSLSTSYSATIPGTAQSGDLLIAWVMHRSALTPPAGWTLINSATCASASVPAHSISVFRRDAVGGDAGLSQNWTQTDSARFAVHIQVWRGPSALSVVASTVRIENSTTTPQTVDYATITSGTYGRVVHGASQIAAVGGGDSTTVDTSVGQLTTHASAINNRLFVAYRNPSAIGTTLSGNFITNVPAGSENGEAAVSIELSTVGVTLLNTQLRVELESVRDGYTSQQMHNFAFERAGWGYNYGNFYGGV